ncbi:MAG: hypothetical protein LBL59_05755 [Xanthomonadaceae bacterium]|jgi:hypothetical protein|nr:hypothetical protein [Xanthomonadaceae bacterium]
MIASLLWGVDRITAHGLIKHEKKMKSPRCGLFILGARENSVRDVGTTKKVYS